jgi:hypothetical protein
MRAHLLVLVERQVDPPKAAPPLAAPADPIVRAAISLGALEERLARNEALFREVNEGVAEFSEQFVEVPESAPTRQLPRRSQCSDHVSALDGLLEDPVFPAPRRP